MQTISDILDDFFTQLQDFARINPAYEFPTALALIHNKLVRALALVERDSAAPVVSESAEKPVEESQSSEWDGSVTGWPGLMTAIRQAVGQCPEIFSIHDVMDFINRTWPGEALRPNINTALWKLVNKVGEIEQIDRGKYKRKGFVNRKASAWTEERRREMSERGKRRWAQKRQREQNT